ncbi:MAG: hypothetical protein ACREXW_02025 [Gammaproteobacteria bacterium]
MQDLLAGAQNADTSLVAASLPKAFMRIAPRRMAQRQHAVKAADYFEQVRPVAILVATVTRPASDRSLAAK